MLLHTSACYAIDDLVRYIHHIFYVVLYISIKTKKAEIYFHSKFITI